MNPVPKLYPNTTKRFKIFTKLIHGPEITFLEENLMACEALSMNSLWTLETDVSNFMSISLAHLPVTHRSVAMN